MAVTRSESPVLAGLRPAKGTIRLWALRLGLVVVMSLPALAAAMGGVSSGVARSPYYTDIAGRLPVLHLVRMARELPTALVPMMVLGVVLAVLGDQLLVGGGAALFDPARPKVGRVRVLATVLDAGLEHVWAFLRAVLFGLVFSAIGVGLIRALSRRIETAGASAGWTGEATALILPLTTFLVMALWLATAGAWVFWCRLITAADGRRVVRRTGLLVWRVFGRSPLRSWGMFVALTLVSMILSGAVLFAWRQAEPRTGGAIFGWALAWLLTLAVQAFVWVWLLRSGRLLYASPRFSDLHARPDEPFYVFRVFRKLLWWRRKPAAAPVSTAEELAEARLELPPSPAIQSAPEPEIKSNALSGIDMDLPPDSGPATEPDPDAGSKPPHG